MEKVLAKAHFTEKELLKKGSKHTTYQGDEVTLESDIYAGVNVEVEWTTYALELVHAPEETPSGAKVFWYLIVNGYAQKIFENETKWASNPAYSTKAGVMRSWNLIGVKDWEEYINPYKFYIRSIPTTKDKKEYQVEIKTNDYRGDYSRYSSMSNTAKSGEPENDDDLPF